MLLTAALASACVLAGAVLGVSRPALAAWTGARLAAWTGARLDVPALPARADTQVMRPGTAGARYPRLAWSAGKRGTAAGSAASGPLLVTRAERSACPASAAACVDLRAHLIWLQSGGEVTFGPVRMEPGVPGTPDATPRGRFRVGWKAGPHFVSSEYGDPMPWATFFAPGGVAFHGGSLTKASHGCVHLTNANARYVQAHLPIGAEVVVF